MELHRFRGWRHREHLGPDGQGRHVLTSYGLDLSNTKTYRFNSLGYRGEELAPGAPVKVFVGGCSFTFGTGLNMEEIWAYRFKERLAAARGLSPSGVNLLNFSMGGASNDWIARTLLEQASRLRPDIMIAAFTLRVRFEILTETTTFSFSPVAMEAGLYRGTPDAYIATEGEHLLLGTNSVMERVRMIKNALLLQFYCRAHSIPLLFLFFEALTQADAWAELSMPITDPLLDHIDTRAVVPIDPTMRVDSAADDDHPGAGTNQLLGDAAWRTFSARYPSAAGAG